MNVDWQCLYFGHSCKYHHVKWICAKVCFILMIQYVFGDDLICICWWFHMHFLMINNVFTDDTERKFLSGQKEVGREVWVLPAVSTSIDGSIIIASNRAINGIKYTRTNTLNDVEYKFSKHHVKSKRLIDRLHSKSTSDELSCISTTLPGPSYMPFWFQKHNFWDLSIYDIWTLILDINGYCYETMICNCISSYILIQFIDGCTECTSDTEVTSAKALSGWCGAVAGSSSW